MIKLRTGATMATILKRKKAVLIIGSAVILIAFVVGIAAVKKFYSPKNEVGFKAVLVPTDDIQAAAMGYSRVGDADGGLALFDSQIDQRQDDDEKRRLLIYKSSFAIEVKRYKEALDAAKQADTIKSDFSTAVVLARAYEGSGDTKQALSYYRKTLELSPKEGLAARYNPMWEQKISELQQ